MPPDVRKIYGLPAGLPLDSLGLRPQIRGGDLRQFKKSRGKAEPFRTSGGPAANATAHLGAEAPGTAPRSSSWKFLASKPCPEAFRQHDH